MVLAAVVDFSSFPVPLGGWTEPFLKVDPQRWVLEKRLAGIIELTLGRLI